MSVYFGKYDGYFLTSKTYFDMLLTHLVPSGPRVTRFDCGRIFAWKLMRNMHSYVKCSKFYDAAIHFYLQPFLEHLEGCKGVKKPKILTQADRLWHYFLIASSDWKFFYLIISLVEIWSLFSSFGNFLRAPFSWGRGWLGVGYSSDFFDVLLQRKRKLFDYFRVFFLILDMSLPTGSC